MIKTWLQNRYNELSPKSDKGIEHDYIAGYYDAEFSQYKYQKINIMEIGVQKGYSMNLWKSYFEIPGLIVGVDINITDEAKSLMDEYVFTNYKNSWGNIKLIETDAYSKEFADEFFDGTFDYIIDDGPHTLESQLKFIDLYYRKTKRFGGKLIIEDIQSKEDLEAIENKLKAEDKPYTVYDLTANKGRYDDILIEIRRKP